MNSNPLQQYFRQPGLYIDLPSRAEFYPEGTIERTENNRYPVFPMTTADEVSFNMPAGSSDGSFLVSLIQSCLPNIKDAWKMPGIDLDKVLLAIKIATYGNVTELDGQCPNCNHRQSISVDLQSCINQIKAPDFKIPIEYSDLKIFLKPMNFREISNNNQLQYEEQLVLDSLQSDDINDQEKLTRVTQVLEKINSAVISALSSNISYIKTPKDVVSEPAHIIEWLRNCDRNNFDLIKNQIIAVKTQSEIKPVTVKCSNCGTDYQQPISLN